MIEKIKEFFADVSKEMKKVSWPTRDQLQESTMIVIVACLVIAVFVYAVDTGMTFLMKSLF